VDGIDPPPTQMFFIRYGYPENVALAFKSCVTLSITSFVEKT
jgi:hypothetical protein